MNANKNGYTGRKVTKYINMYNAHGEIEKFPSAVTLYEKTRPEFKESSSIVNTVLNLLAWPIVAAFVWAIIKLMSM